VKGRELKLKELPYMLGLQPGPKTYGYRIKRFDLPGDGIVEYAQWKHPSEAEKEITQPAIDALRKFLSPGDVAIDIGAHSGDSAVPIALAAGAEGCVLALEPNSYVFPTLKKNAELNPGKTKIIPLMFAATAQDAEMEFLYSDSGYCNGGRFEGISKWLHWHAFRLKVHGRNLQSFLKATYPELIPKIRYIKIDTEGYDSVVLESLSELILSSKPYLKVEVYRRLDEVQRRTLYRVIERYGYAVHKFEGDEHYCGELVTAQDMNKWRHFDVFCVPESLPAPHAP
jgi:FkbM family methyltransferase